jgi:hypothetical protein
MLLGEGHPRSFLKVMAFLGSCPDLLAGGSVEAVHGDDGVLLVQLVDICWGCGPAVRLWP